ncbi:MAG: ATP-binding protein [Kineosporiaceae bacterium]|nr:ATP-binding protein [Kineosporiaceae bacterium]MBK7624173.1 ATP-binding protein [Kineosporiaceae bacterium]
MPLDLVERYGLPARLVREAPSDALVALRYGRVVSGECAPWPGPPRRRWVRVLAVPEWDGGTESPLAMLLSVLAGPGMQLDVVLRHDDASGIGLYLGFLDQATTARARALLTPDHDLEEATPPGAEAWHALGVVHRVQGVVEVREGSPAIERPESLVDRIQGIPGSWCVHWHLTGSGPQQVDALTERLLALADQAATMMSVTTTLTAVESTTVVSQAWTRVQTWLDVLYAHGTRGRTIGLWSVDTWAAGPDPATLDQVIAALRAAVPGESGRSFAASALAASGGAAPTSLLTSADLGGMLVPPRRGVPGLAVRAAPPGGRRPTDSSQPIELGTYWGVDLPAQIGLDDLEGHGFLTGTTGSGKTTSLHRLLAALWNDNHVPFLVIDPVKDEYSGAASLFRGGVRVVTGNDLRMNLLEPWPGTDDRRHIVQVAQAFRGAFTMPSPAPYVVTHLFDTVAMQPGGPAGATLHDIRDALDPLIDSLGYAAEARTNIRAALMTRLSLLLAPVRAHRFGWPNSSMVHGLFDQPTVVTLADLVDDEERSFIVLLLAMATWNRARARARSGRPLAVVDHVLVLEEAHRVIPELGPSAPDSENGSAARVSAELLSAMLAEVRSYGQQVLVVDQSPSKVSSDVLRNTNLKLVHRIVHPDDQQQVAGAIGLPPDRAGLLGTLQRGQVLVSTRSEPVPQTVRVHPASPRFPARAATVASGASTWPCCTAETAVAVEDHFRAWAAAPEAASHLALFLVGLRLGEGDGTALRAKVYRSLLSIGAGLPTDCLAWAGLRRVIGQERSLGAIGSRKQYDVMLGVAFQAWQERRPAEREAATLPGLRGGVCDQCGRKCQVRVPAAVLNRAAPRYGPGVLRTAGWRRDLPDVVDWGVAQFAELLPLLGERAAKTVMRCQLAQGVQQGALPRSVLEQLVARICP